MRPAFLSPEGTRLPRKETDAVLDVPEQPLDDDLGSSQSFAWEASLFREQFLVLRFYGLPFSGLGLKQHMYSSGIKDRRRERLARAVSFVFPALCAAYTVHCGTSLLLALKRGRDATTALLPDTSDICRVAVSFLTATHAARNGAKVLALVHQSAAAMFGGRGTSQVQRVKPAEWSAMRRTVLASTLFALMSWAVFVALRISTLRRRGIREYCDTYLYGFAPSGDNSGPGLYVAPVLDALLYGIVLALPRWSMALNVSLCHFLGVLGKQLSTSMQLASETREHQLAVTEVRELRMCHAALCRAIGRCDDLYGWLLFFCQNYCLCATANLFTALERMLSKVRWLALSGIIPVIFWIRCGDAVICFVFGVPWIMAQADVDDFSGYAAASIDVTLGVLLLVAVFVAASEPGRLAKESLTPHVLRLSCCQSVSGVDGPRKEKEVALNQELLLLATSVRAARVEMSGWNCFDVHRGTTITVLSMLATYAVIVYQMLHHID